MFSLQIEINPKSTEVAEKMAINENVILYNNFINGSHHRGMELFVVVLILKFIQDEHVDLRIT